MQQDPLNKHNAVTPQVTIPDIEPIYETEIASAAEVQSFNSHEASQPPHLVSKEEAQQSLEHIEETENKDVMKVQKNIKHNEESQIVKDDEESETPEDDEVIQESSAASLVTSRMKRTRKSVDRFTTDLSSREPKVLEIPNVKSCLFPTWNFNNWINRDQVYLFKI